MDVHLVGNDEVIIDNRRDKHFIGMSNMYSNIGQDVMDIKAWQEDDRSIIRVLAQLLFF